jgi:hypothetical protein
VRRDGSVLAAELAGVFEADGVRAAVAGLLSGARRAVRTRSQHEVHRRRAPALAVAARGPASAPRAAQRRAR